VLRGRAKDALILALAQGDRTHAELADEHPISEQGIAQFAVRNRATIQAVKDAGLASLAGMWGADRRARIAEYQQVFEDLEGELSDDSLSFNHRHRVRTLQVKVLHELAEQCGQLTLRTEVKLDTARPVLVSIINGQEWDAEQRRWVPSAHVPDWATPGWEAPTAQPRTQTYEEHLASVASRR
jgi:hypothetical protein